MYTKKILSAAAAVAVISTGAMAFDFTTAGTIIDDITKSNDKNASYINGVEANASLTLSTNSKGDALIYPAFRTDGWDSELVVRNSINRAVVAKVVLYAKDNSRELVDFDIYLSPYDVFRFQINADRTITTSDGSFAKVDPTLGTDTHEFITKETPIATLPDDIDSGYAVIYGMTEANITGVYDGKHDDLFRDFRRVVDVCRDDDNLTTTTPSWRATLAERSPGVSNGTAVDTNVTAPNVASNCLVLKMNENGDYNATVNAMDSNFTSVSSDALFGDIRISHAGDKRDLLIKATALDNYTADNQMMLWVPGEYASIQDRRIFDANATLPGTDNQVQNGFSDYNITGIEADAQAFITQTVYYTFDDNEMKGSNTVLVTQPMKRALVMGGDRRNYWQAVNVTKNATSNTWGEFSVTSQYRDEAENLDTTPAGVAVVVSPVSSDPEMAYSNELEVFNDPERSETNPESTHFRESKTDGFAIMQLGVENRGLPAIVTQMSGSVVDGEGQINWIYSTTDKD